MLIGLDEKRIDADGYEPQSLWNWVDGLFAELKWTKETQPDGTVLYSGGLDNVNLFADGFVIYRTFSSDTNFMKYCNKWLGFDNEDDETLPLTEENYLEVAKNAKMNSLQG